MKRLLYILLFFLCAGVLFHAIGAKKPRKASADVVDTVLYNYLYMEGEKQLLLGNNDAALALLNEANRVNPSGQVAKFSLCDIYIKMKQPDKAISLLQQVVESDTTHYWYNMSYVHIIMQLQRYDEAEMIVKRLIRNHPNKPELYNALAVIHIYKNEYDKALSCYDTIETYMGNSPDLASYRINLYDAMGDTAKAIDIAEELVEKNPMNEYYILYLSGVYAHYGCDSLRLQLLDYAATVAPQEPLLRVERAHYFLSQSDTTTFYHLYDQLFADANIDFEAKYQMFNDYIREISNFASDSVVLGKYRQLIDLYPYETDLRKDYTSILLYKEDFDEACKQTRTIALQTDSIVDWEKWMIVANEAGNNADVIEAAQHLMDEGVARAVTYVYMCSSLSLEERYDEAEEYIHKGLDVSEGNLETSYLYNLLGDIYSTKGVLEKCFQYYDSALVYNPDNAMLLNNYAYNLAETGGDLLKAETMSAKSLKLMPDNITFIDTYAWIMFRMESYFIARVYIEQALQKLNPDDPDVAIYYEHYGDILAMLGEVDNAVKQWKIAQEKGGGSNMLDRKIELKQYIENETNSTDINNTADSVDDGL